MGIVCGNLALFMVVSCTLTSCHSEQDSAGAYSEHNIAQQPLGSEATEALIAQANSLMEAEEFQQVVDLLQPAASRFDVDPQISLLYGRALFANGQSSLAVWPLARAADGAGPASFAAYHYANALFTGGDPETAILELDRLLALEPDNIRLLSLRAQAHNRNLDYELALIDLDYLIELGPKELGGYEVRVDVLVKLDRLEEAYESMLELGELIKKSDASTDVKGRFCGAAATFVHQHELEGDARAQFEACLAEFPTVPDVVLPWIAYLDQVDGLEAATEALEEIANGVARTRLRLRIALANRYAVLGQIEDATQVLTESAAELGVPEPLFALADHLVAREDLAGAQGYINKAIEMSLGAAPGAPDFSWTRVPAEGRFALGDILIRIADYDAVEDLISSFEMDSDEDDESEEVYPILLRARLHLVRGEPSEALELFEESFRYWPSNIGSRYLAARAAMELGDFERGMSFYQDAFRANPAASDAGIVYARLQDAQGLGNAAIDSLSTLLGERRDYPKALDLFARLASRFEAYEMAQQARLDLAVYRTWRGLAIAGEARDEALQNGIEAAIAQLESIEGFDSPDNYESLWQWVQFQNDLGKIDQAVARLEELRAMHPDAASLEVVAARTQELVGSKDAAKASYEKAVDFDPSLAVAHRELGLLLLEANDIPGAQSALSRALTLDADDLEAKAGYAEAASRSGWSAEVEDLYRQILIDHPWHGDAAKKIAQARFEARDYGEQALIWARWGSRFNALADTDATILLAELRLARDEPNEALAALNLAARQTTIPRPEILYLTAIALERLGDYSQAAEAVTEALALGEFPGMEEARKLLDTLKNGGQS
jgi:tetratricopeptide (TPR) repeat protein